MLPSVLSSFALVLVLSHRGRRAAAVYPSRCPFDWAQEGSNEQRSYPSPSRDSQSQVTPIINFSCEQQFFVLFFFKCHMEMFNVYYP